MYKNIVVVSAILIAGCGPLVPPTPKPVEPPKPEPVKPIEETKPQPTEPANNIKRDVESAFKPLQNDQRETVSLNEILDNSAEFDKKNIGMALAYQDEFTFYENSDFSLNAKRKLKKGDTPYQNNYYLDISQKDLSLALGNIYNGYELISDLKKGSSLTRINGIQHKGDLRLNGINFSGNKDYTPEYNDVFMNGNVVTQTINRYIKPGNLSFSDRGYSKLNYVSDFNSDTFNVATKFTFPKASLGFGLTNTNKNELKKYEYTIVNNTYSVDYEMTGLLDRGTERNKSYLNVLGYDKSPVYVSKIVYGYGAKISIESYLEKNDLEMVMNGSYNVAELESKYTSAQRNIRISSDVKTYGGLGNIATLKNTANIQDIHSQMKTFESEFHNKVKESVEQGKVLGVPVAAEFRYLGSGKPVPVNSILTNSLDDYDLNIKGAKTYKIYVANIVGRNINNKIKDSVFVSAKVDYLYDLKELMDEITEDLVDEPNYFTDVSNKKIAQDINTFLSQSFKAMSHKIQSQQHNSFVYTADLDNYRYDGAYARGRDVFQANLEASKDNDLTSYLMIEEILLPYPKPVMRCTNSTFPCDSYTEFGEPKVNEKDGYIEFIYQNNRMTVTIRAVEVH